MKRPPGRAILLLQAPHAQQVVLTILCWSLHSFKTTMLPEVAKTWNRDTSWTIEPKPTKSEELGFWWTKSTISLFASFGDHWNSTNLGTSLSSSFPPGHHQKSDIRRSSVPFQSAFLMCFLWMEQVPHLWSVRRMPQTVNPNPHPVQCNVYLAWLVNCSFKGLPSVCFTNRNSSRFVALCKVPSRILCRKEMLGFYNANLQSNKRFQEPPKWWFYDLYCYHDMRLTSTKGTFN